MGLKRSVRKKNSLPPCERLAWDSEFFGVETARVRGDWLTGARVKAIDECCERGKVAWLYFLGRGDDAETTRCAEAGGFGLVDVRVTYERAIGGEIAADAEIRRYEEADLPGLLKIARTSYVDSRFYYDRHISRKKCNELFETWTKRCCEKSAERVLVATPGDRRVVKSGGAAVGYVTMDFDAQQMGWGTIGLIGVTEKARGAGVGERLVKGALRWAASEGLAGMTVVTQGRNIAAQRLYQRCGFIIRSLQLYYHKWYE